MRVEGATLPELLQFMRRVLPGHRNGAIRYLNEAFCQKLLRLNYALVQSPAWDTQPHPEMLEYAERWVDEERPLWESQPYPELKRTRDYFSFLQFARKENLIVTVCGAKPDDEHYRLHGVYDAAGGEPAWSATRGERLRATLNRCLGSEFVLGGPHDDWEHRNSPEIAGELCGPQLPVIEFSHNGTIQNHLKIHDLATTPPYTRHWSRLYPNHPA
jgi:hypothetical protein